MMGVRVGIDRLRMEVDGLRMGVDERESGN